MPEAFLHLPSGDRADILVAGAARLGRPANILEKDVWVCWTLARLFSIPDLPKMAFKGGTSLSKVYGAIERFSEDIDVTLDFRSLAQAPDPFAPTTSNAQKKKLSDKLKEAVSKESHDRIVPHLRDSLLAADADGRIEVSDNGEQVWLYYPSALSDRDGYIRESVLLEFGGRNVTEPNERREIRPYLDGCFEGVQFESAMVDVLSPARTFWEKATLAHVECHRNDFRVDANRLSRHWYDLFKLADNEIGRDALKNRALLDDVVKHKQVFYNTATSRYDLCLSGGFRLLPDGDALAALRRDFEAMKEAGMFSGEVPSFEAILERLVGLEQEINRGHV